MMEFDLENPLPSSDDDSIAALFAAETDHMTSLVGGAGAGLDLSARSDAITVILQAQFACDLDPLVSYLAVNYVDRFLSKREIPKGKPWIVRLLSISCLSLAAKMKRADFSVADFQREEGFIFDAQTIRRMELLVLGALDWRMRSITPFSFLPFFMSSFASDHPPFILALKSRASQTLLRAQNEVKMLEFCPSVIAASALLSAARDLFPTEFPSFRSAICSCQFVDKEKLRECCSAMGGGLMDGCDSTFEGVSSCDTPVTVLGRPYSRSESDWTVGSESDGKKRRTTGL